MTLNGRRTMVLPPAPGTPPVAAAATATVAFSARTDVGQVRKANEDSISALSPVFLVADGMGGHAHGDIASQTAVRVFDEHIERDRPSTPERILDAIHSSNDAVRDLSTFDDHGTAVSGTTLAGVALVDAGDDVGYYWMAFNVGDSRVYTWDGGLLCQLSVDHSAVQEMVDAGVISAADAEQHPERNVITRAIGADEYVDADVWLLPAVGRQRFLVCSDGLTKELGAAEISLILQGRPDDEPDATAETETQAASTVADELVQAALAHGGRDNISVVYVDSRVAAAQPQRAEQGITEP
ncbi:MAG: protein phosphatase 2C domain-containing protein [Cryobacterium sp.]